MADAPEWKEQSCGACGESKWRVRALESKLAGHGAYRDLALVCTGCGSVTHLVPRTFISAEWGREAEGRVVAFTGPPGGSTGSACGASGSPRWCP